MSIVTVQAQCSKGFPTQSFINNNTAGATERAGFQLFFFSMNFTCQAEISKIIIAAREDITGGQTREYPLMETWRQDNNVYNRVNSVGSVTGEVTSLGSSLYQYVPSQTTTVLPGDIFGMRIIPSDQGNPRTRLLPYFVDQNSNAPEYFERTITASTMLADILVYSDDLKNRYFPLVTVEISKLYFYKL